MKLFIHFGIYKAGSSYLQYVLANSRTYLSEKGIYFPNSLQDKKMLQGLISPGNADGLEEVLKVKNEKGLQRLLGQWKEAAKRKQCDRVLLSAEALVHQLAKKDTLEFLEKVTKDSGYTKIHAMGFFRDLTDHALSTYKHRAKSGKIPDYETWVKEVYETPQLLQSLAERRKDKHGLVWTFRKFYKKSESLQKAFFQDWLQIDEPNFSGRPAVNESVTLSEVLVMNEVNRLYPSVTDYFVRDLKSVPMYKKVKDQDLEDFFGGLFYNNLTSYVDLVNSFNQYLPQNEYLEIGSKDFCAIALSNEVPALRLNSYQLQIILKRMMFFSSSMGLFIGWRRKIVNSLPEEYKRVIRKRKRL